MENAAMPPSTEHTQACHDWRGTAYDIGVQHGKALARQIVAEFQPTLDAIVARCGTDASAFLERYAQVYEPQFRRHAPRAIDEIRGLADGSGLDWPRAFFAATRDGAKLADTNRESCTAFYCAAQTTADGHVLIGQTKDTGAPLDRYHVMRRSYDDGLTVLTLNYPGWIANIGLNSHGVGCTGNSLYARPADLDTVPYSLMRYLIAEAASVHAIRRAIDELPMENGCMTIADAAGDAICVESVAGRRDCRNIAGLAFGHANTVLCPELAAQQNDAQVTVSSHCRQRNMQRLLDAGRGRLDVAAMRSILTDHSDYPRSICLHPVPGSDIVTTAALVCDCTAATVDIVIGQPCRSAFVRYPVRSG